MKIIGKTMYGYMLDASKAEVANLIGYYGWYDLNKNEDLNIGDEIQISEMYKQLYDLSKKHEDIMVTKQRLQECIGLLNLIEPVIDVKLEMK